jgi:hypothetical protein
MQSSARRIFYVTGAKGRKCMRKVVGCFVVLAALVGMGMASGASAEGRSHGYSKASYCKGKYHSRYHCKRWYRKTSAKRYFARQKKNGS